ncbi:MAG: M50 family metallopeptidase [Candidatus Saccharicenans sp.]|nr:MAG: protease [Candidatus Aminicenantes bacterium]HEK86079.1 site-2 protease family protein [Candidatus Aminicenantes bacterium]
MKHSWKIGRVAGIDLKVDSSWIIIFLLFVFSLALFYFPQSFKTANRLLYWVLAIFTSLLVFASVLFHELAHSLIAKRQGEKVEDITLFILGGVARITEEPEKPQKEFYMALVGPLSSFFLAIIFVLLALLTVRVSPALRVSFVYLAYINAVLGAFNLLPGFPMDGGRVLRAIIWKVTGDLKKATRIASSVGQFIAFLMIFVGIFMFFKGNIGGLWLVLIGWFVHSASVQGYSQVLLKESLQGLKASDLMSRDFVTIEPDLSVDALVHDYVLKKRERVFLVKKGEEFIGLVCLEDIKKFPRERWPELKVADIMTPKEKIISVSTEATGDQILSSLASFEVNQLPVLDSGQVVGLIYRNDLLKTLQLRIELGM